MQLAQPGVPVPAGVTRFEQVGSEDTGLKGQQDEQAAPVTPQDALPSQPVFVSCLFPPQAISLLCHVTPEPEHGQNEPEGPQPGTRSLALCVFCISTLLLSSTPGDGAGPELLETPRMSRAGC